MAYLEFLLQMLTIKGMYLLRLIQRTFDTYLAAFETMDNCNNFIKLLQPFSFHDVPLLDKNGNLLSSLDPKKIPVYTELRYKNIIVPLSSLSFTSEDEIQIAVSEICNADIPRDEPTIASGMSYIDGYVFDNAELKAYLTKRTSIVEGLSKLLVEKGFKPSLDFRGSQDGEALCYCTPDGDWHFVTHLDPSFIENTETDEENLRKVLDELLN